MFKIWVTFEIDTGKYLMNYVEVNIFAEIMQKKKRKKCGLKGDSLQKNVDKICHIFF